MLKSRVFANGEVYALDCGDGYPIEVTDTFLPAYTKDCAHQRTNRLQDYRLGSRAERWMIGVSTMSGCPVRCKFCAAGQLKRWRNLTAEEIVGQVDFVLGLNPDFKPEDSWEFKINYTRMGEPMLNLGALREAIEDISARFPKTHHYVSTIGIRGMDTSWVKDNITLQISLHSLDEDSRNWLIPFRKKMPIQELGQIRTESALKTTLNMTLVDFSDFDIEALKAQFDPKNFFIKLSPINPNPVSEHYQLGSGVVDQENLV
ncbi:MAG: radical SAM protein [Candidatus Odinarchaeota archaeon]